MDLRPSFLPALLSCVFPPTGIPTHHPRVYNIHSRMSPGTLPIPSLWSRPPPVCRYVPGLGAQKPLRTRSEPHKGRIWGRRGQSPAKLLTYGRGESTPGGPCPYRVHVAEGTGLSVLSPRAVLWVIEPHGDGIQKCQQLD